MLERLRFHHIGVATPDIGATAKMYEQAGYAVTPPVVDPLQNVRICFLAKEGMPTVELLEPIDDKSPVVKILEKNGVSPYHCCYVSDRPEEDIAELRRMGYVVVSRLKEACAMEGKRVAFLYHKNVGLIELVEA